MADRTRIVEVIEHKVKKGDTLASLAEAHGLTWQQLAVFNWGTSKPAEINKHLRNDVGCTKRTRDRKNYIFDDSDDPGLIYIPKLFRLKPLATKRTHLIRVKIVPAIESKPFLFSA